MPLDPGTKLGPYEILSPLGAGGMGEVYRALDSRLGRNVAIKVLPQRLSQETELRERLEHEARTISKLSHPNVCTLHDIGHEHGMDFLVLEFVEGKTLRKLLDSGVLTMRKAIPIAVQVDPARILGCRPGQYTLKELPVRLSGRHGRLRVGGMSVCHHGRNGRIWPNRCLYPIQECALVFFGLPGHS